MLCIVVLVVVISLVLVVCFGKEFIFVIDIQSFVVQLLAEVFINFLLSVSMLLFQVLLFDRIKDSDYLLVFNEGMKQYLVEVCRIVDNFELVIFDNIIEVLECSGEILNCVLCIFFGLVQVDINDVCQKIQEEVVFRLVEYQDEINFDLKLFVCIKIVYDQCDVFGLDLVQKCLVECDYQEFVCVGVQFNDVDKVFLCKFNVEEIMLVMQFYI